MAAFALRLPLEEGPWAASDGAWAAWIRGMSTLLLVLSAPFAVLLILSRKRGEPRRVLHVALLVALVLVDVAVLAFVPTRLVCYGCGTSYRGARMARMHRAWDPRVAASVRRGAAELPS